MSVETEIEVEGAEELKQTLGRLDVEMQNRLHERLAEWAETVRVDAQHLAPVRTGYLRTTIYARTREWQAEIGAEAILRSQRRIWHKPHTGKTIPEPRCRGSFARAWTRVG